VDFQIVLDNAPLLVQAGITTVWIFVVTAILGTIFGSVIAVLRQFGPKPIARFCQVYSWFLRCVPALLVLFYAFYGLPEMGIFLSPDSAAIVGLTVSTSAYMSETFRCGLLALRRDQLDAARSLGLPFSHILRRIVLPQAAVVVLPPWTSNLILLLKGTSLASVVAVAEMTGVTYRMISTTYRPYPFLITSAIFYLALVTGITIAFRHLERRTAGSWR